MIPEEPAARHRSIAATFADRVHGVADWEAGAPVAGWTAADVVHHLVDWSTGFLAAGGVALPPATATSPGARWEHHVTTIQDLLDGDGAGAPFTHPQVGTFPLATAIDTFYTSDVFLHTWDLARATGQDEALDDDECTRLLVEMEPMDGALRASGHYGERVPVDDDASPLVRIIAFIGRDPSWTAPAT